jgi:hypothetical protein
VKKKKSRIVDSFFLLLLASSSTCFSNRYKMLFVVALVIGLLSLSDTALAQCAVWVNGSATVPVPTPCGYSDVTACKTILYDEKRLVKKKKKKKKKNPSVISINSPPPLKK